MVKWQRLTTGPPITAQRGWRCDRGGHRTCRNTGWLSSSPGMGALGEVGKEVIPGKV